MVKRKGDTSNVNHRLVALGAELVVLGAELVHICTNSCCDFAFLAEVVAFPPDAVRGKTWGHHIY